MMKLVVLVCLAQVVLGDFNVKFNQLLDGQLIVVNAGLAQQNVHSVNLGDQNIGGATVKGITIGDVATIQRIGDATMKAADDTTLQVASNIGLNNMTVHVSSYSSPQANFQDALFVIGSNQLSWAYSVSFTPTGGCSIAIQDLEISVLDKVTMYSSDPKMNDIDVSAQFGQVRQVINGYFKSPQFAALLEKNDPCKGSSTVWSKAFNLLA